MNQELEEAVKRVQAIGSFERATEIMPEWLDYGVLCNHDEGWLCEHRMKYLLSVIRGEPIPIKNYDAE